MATEHFLRQASRMFRVITSYPDLTDPNYDRYVNYLNESGLVKGKDWDVQQIGDNWHREDHCWYFESPEVQMQFKIYTGGNIV
mgnify:CR=1 FL=1